MHISADSLTQTPFLDSSTPEGTSVYVRQAVGARIGSMNRKGNVVAGARSNRQRRRVRAHQLLCHEESFIYHRSFDDADARDEILGPPPTDRNAKSRRLPADADFYVAHLYKVPLLDQQTETYLFRKLNYLKFLASRLRRRLDPERASHAQLDKLEHLLEAASETRNSIVEANLRLAFAMAKRYAMPGTPAFDEFISEGNVTLMRAAEKFDFSRGVKFSTYATWAVVNGFNALLKKKATRERRQISDQVEGVSESLTDQSESLAKERTHRDLKGAIAEILGDLSDRERKIIEARFGFNDELRPPTLRELGTRIGVSKERVRQLQERAIQKLRQIVASSKLELPEI